MHTRTVRARIVTSHSGPRETLRTTAPEARWALYGIVGGAAATVAPHLGWCSGGSAPWPGSPTGGRPFLRAGFVIVTVIQHDAVTTYHWTIGGQSSMPSRWGR
jgi:hypothetical protein